MLVKIVDGEGQPDGVVTLHGTGVRGAVHWDGQPPDGNIEIDVELGIRDPISWTDVSAGEVALGAMRKKSQFAIQGEVEDYDHDDVLTLRVGQSIVLLDMIGEPPLHIVGQKIVIIVSNVVAYPTGIA